LDIAAHRITARKTGGARNTSFLAYDGRELSARNSGQQHSGTASNNSQQQRQYQPAVALDHPKTKERLKAPLIRCEKNQVM
jgi:hypothetical protein